MDATMGIDTNPIEEPEVLDVIPSLSDDVPSANLDGQNVYVIYHGGCPDGCLAAHIMHHALQAHYKPSHLFLCPTSHGARNADMLEDGCTAIFVDVGPTPEDAAKLRACGYVIILDHHKSQEGTIHELLDLVPQLYDYSEYDGLECGASLVAKFCGSHVVPPWISQLFHNNDVHDHELPEGLLQYRDAFQGYITQNGVGKCSIQLVEQFLRHPSAALEEGAKLYIATATYTRALFEQRELLKDTPKVSIFAVDMGQPPAAVDDQLYQGLINSLATDKAVLFVTMNRMKLASRCWNIGLRRAGEQLDVGVVAAWLGGCNFLGMVIGGGHPYAAGVQCDNFDVPAQAIIDQLSVICEFGPKEKPKLVKK